MPKLGEHQSLATRKKMVLAWKKRSNEHFKIVCSFCGKIFDVVASRKNRAHFCSQKCQLAELMKRNIARASLKRCSVENCTHKYCAKGFCNFHYMRKRFGTKMDKPLKPSKIPRTKQQKIDRLFSHRKILPNGCWEFIGHISKQGYGRLGIGRKLYKANRLSAILWLGLKEDSPLYALHKCNNRKCFNPQHLYLGTQIDNMRDRKLRNILCPL